MGICHSTEVSHHVKTENVSSAAQKRRNSSEGKRVKTMTVEEFRRNPAKGDLCVFSYGEMIAATKNFRRDKVIGSGGFGAVYKGVIDDSVRTGFPATLVAIKELNKAGFQGDREWLAEVNHLGQLHHPNLVKLIGYCCDDDHRFLVYEYMASGSLENHLFRQGVSLNLNWKMRLQIALAAAKGLAFLHGAEKPLIYRDFKTSNILLDVDYNAKLSDFGLAKEGPVGDETHVSTRVVGTHGYAAPEYIMTGRLTALSDVYGFGVVLLEMMTGMKALDNGRPSREQRLVEWARPRLKHRRLLMKLIDPRMKGQYSDNSVERVAALVYNCLGSNPRSRPTMVQIVETLESLYQECTASDGDRGSVVLSENNFS